MKDTPHAVPPDVHLKRPQVRQETAATATVGELTAPDIALTQPSADLRDAEITGESLGELHPGPNPYGDFDRRLTEAGSFLFTFSAKDDRLWVRCLRLGAWLATTGIFGWWLIQPPLAGALLWKVPLWLGGAYLCWKLLVEDRGHPCTIEVWSDSFVVDDKDIFWRAYLELGLPTLVTVGEDAYALAGTYGTRHVEFCRIHAFDENDRQPQVFLAQVQFAMQQMWSDPA